MSHFVFKRPRRQPLSEAIQDNRDSGSGSEPSTSGGNPTRPVDQNVPPQVETRQNIASSFLMYRSTLADSNSFSIESDPSYSEFCEGNFFNSTDALSEELSLPSIYGAASYESDNGDDDEFILEDGNEISFKIYHAY